MQTLTIEVKDDFMTEFMKIIDSAKDKVSASRNFKNELDKRINIQDDTLAILDIFNQNKR